MNKSTQNTQFEGWRAFFWPVHNFELKKFIPMFLLFFFINFNYTILRDMKDALVVTAPGSGAETIPFLKGYGVLPGAILFMLLYSKLSNVLSKEKLFYSIVGGFTLFFAAFPTLLYPFRDFLHPNALIDSVQDFFPSGLHGLLGAVRNWTYSLFYVMAELWGSVAISLLFWGFANDITKLSESKRFYSMFGLGANCAMLVSGPIIYLFSRIDSFIPKGIDPWQVSLNMLMGALVTSCLLIIAIYHWIQRNVLTDPLLYSPEEAPKKKSKQKPTLLESARYILGSPYFLCLAILVSSYGISIQLVEMIWKNQLKLCFPRAIDYTAFMGIFSTLTGLATIVMMFVGGSIIRTYGWLTGALATPVVLLISGIAFFFLILLKGSLPAQLAFGITPLQLAVICGTLQNIVSKSFKYSLFDPTKEMAYIPLDPEMKSKGKAAVDVVVARLGKSGGGFINQFLLVATGSIVHLPPYVACIMVGIISAWISAARDLNKRLSSV